MQHAQPHAMKCSIALSPERLGAGRGVMIPHDADTLTGLGPDFKPAPRALLAWSRTPFSEHDIAVRSQP